MDYYGFVGRVASVNLTTSKVKEEPLDLKLAEKFIGGWGINYKLLNDELKPGTHPLSPESPTIIGVGPLCGTLAPSSGKVVATMKFPTPASKKEEKYIVATGVGGNRRFGAMIKNAGYDHVVITGRAPKPSYLKISDDGIEICDASDLWGKCDIYETTDTLAYRHRGRTGKAGVWAIGRAGENQIVAAIGLVDKKGSLGQWGSGAVLGSKNLKAIVSIGTKGVKVAEQRRFMELVDATRKKITTHPRFLQVFPEWEVGMFGAPSDGYEHDLIRKTGERLTACMGCVDPCRLEHRIDGGRFDGHRMITGHFIVVQDFGRRLKLKDYRETTELVDRINRAGLNYAGTLRLLYFITRLYERGIINDKDTGGLVLTSGDFDSYARLLEKYINRKDVGEVMSQGWYAVSEKFGVDAGADRDGATILRGGDSLVDPRFALFGPACGMALILRPRAQHLHQGTYYPAGPDIHRDTYWPEYKRSLNDLKRDMLLTGATEEDVARAFTENDVNMGRLEKHHEDAHGVYNSVGICDTGSHWTWDAMRNVLLLADFYSAATGLQVNGKELKKRGERVWTMERLANVREGWSREDEEIPACWLNNMEKPLHFKTGERYFTDWFHRRLEKEQIVSWLDDYYEERGWDTKKGIPTLEKLRDLELEEFEGIVKSVLQ